VDSGARKDKEQVADAGVHHSPQAEKHTGHGRDDGAQGVVEHTALCADADKARAGGAGRGEGEDTQGAVWVEGVDALEVGPIAIVADGV